LASCFANRFPGRAGGARAGRRAALSLCCWQPSDRDHGGPGRIHLAGAKDCPASALLLEGASRAGSLRGTLVARLPPPCLPGHGGLWLSRAHKKRRRPAAGRVTSLLGAADRDAIHHLEAGLPLSVLPAQTRLSGAPGRRRRRWWLRPSSGLALAGAFKMVPDEPGAVCVVIFPDNAFKYMSSFKKHLPELF